MAETNDKLRKLQLTDLELFKKFTRVCEENDITYYALGGTLLGAVRHGGFIPWDDDMDVGIPRGDYDRFLSLAETRQLPFEVHSFFNDKDHYRYFAHIEDPAVKIKRTDNIVAEMSSAWIDVFPLDGMPNNPLLRSIHKYYLLYRRAMYKLSCFSLGVNVNKRGRPLHERILVKLGQILPVEKMLSVRSQLRKLDRALKRFPYEKSDWLVNAMGAYKFDEMFHKRHYGAGRELKFEDTTIHAPRDYRFVCHQLYGDYMTPPAAADRDHHSSEVI